MRGREGMGLRGLGFLFERERDRVCEGGFRVSVGGTWGCEGVRGWFRV